VAAPHVCLGVSFGLARLGHGCRRSSYGVPRVLQANLTLGFNDRSFYSATRKNNGEEHLNTKRWLLASVAVVVVIGVLEFLIHGVLLSDIYKQTASVWRSEAEMQKMMWMFWVGILVFAPFFVLIYVKGYEKGKPGLGQGFRYGLYVGAMLSVMNSFGWYVLLPIPLALVFYWFLAILAEFILAGIAAGLVYHE